MRKVWVMRTVAAPLNQILPVQQASDQTLRSDLIYLGGFCCLAVLAVLSRSIYALLPVAGVSIYLVFIVLVRRPLWAFAAALFVQHFSGLMKQALDFSQVAYFVQDSLFLLFLAPFALRRVLLGKNIQRQRPLSMAIDILLLTFVVLHVIGICNPNSPSPLLALAAVRVRLLPMLMYLIVRDLMREGISVEKTLYNVMALGALCGAVFAIYSSIVGVEGIKHLGPGFFPHQASRVWADASGQQHFRPPSIYSDAGIAVVTAGMFAVFAFLRTSVSSRLAMICRYAIIVLCVVEVVVTGSRSGFLAVMAGLALLLSLMPNRGRRLMIIGAPLILGLTLLAQPQILDRYATVENPVGAYQENRGGLFEVVLHDCSIIPFGRGTGLYTSSADRLAEFFGVHSRENIQGYDNGLSNIFSELGIPGLINYLAILIFVLIMALSGSRQPGTLPEQCSRWKVLAVWSLTLLVSVGGTMITDAFPINVYFWSFLALTLGSARSGGYNAAEGFKGAPALQRGSV